MPIRTLLPFPSIGDPLFEAKADAWAADLIPATEEINAAAAAMTLNATTDTSSSSVLIGTGSKTFTVSPNKSFLGGQYLTIADTSAPSTNSMIVQVTSYNPSTSVMLVNVVSFTGSGTKSAWLISLSANVSVSATAAPIMAATSTAQMRALMGASVARRRNKWINGSCAIDTRSKGAAKTIVAGATPVWTLDQMYASCTGANATVQQTVHGLERRMRLTGGLGCTGIVIGTRIASENLEGLKGGFALLSASIATSASSMPVGWAVYKANGAGQNGFGSLASPTRVLVASGTLTVNTFNFSETKYGALVDLGNFVYTGFGIEPYLMGAGLNIEFSIGSQANNASISFGEFQIESGYLGQSGGFEDSPREELERDCARYCRRHDGEDGIAMVGSGHQMTTTNSRFVINFEEMYKPPSISFNGSIFLDQFLAAPSLTLGITWSSKKSIGFEASHSAVGAAGDSVHIQIPNGVGNSIILEAPL